MFTHNLLIYYQYCFEEKRRKKEEKKRRRLQKKEERKRHFRKWNKWRKRSGDSKLYKFLVLMRIIKSPTFEWYVDGEILHKAIEESFNKYESLF